VRFWDSSALMPLLVIESESEAMKRLVETDDAVAAWWGTPVECASALARRRRAGKLSRTGEGWALAVLERLVGDWSQVAPSESVRGQAAHLVTTHAISAADAFQLAAATVWADGRPRGSALVTLDRRLAEAARLEGFTVLPEDA
jgi:predicted nucleic acid-binding protein